MATREWLICSMMVVMVLVLMFYSPATSSAFFERPANRMEDDVFPNFEKYSEVSECVWNNDVLLSNMKSAKGTVSEKTSLNLLASYAYSNYSVVTIQSKGWLGNEVFCRYLSSSFEEIANPVRSTVFPEHVVHCCRIDGAAYMSVTTSNTESIVEWVPVVDRFTEGPSYSLSLCLAPIYGNESSWLLLAETIEHYRLQGVEHTYVYVKDMDFYSRKLLESYSRTGEIEVIYLDYRDDRPGKEWQMVGIQDCLQRSRHHSRWSIFADIDERILPTSDVTLSQFTRKLFEKDPTLALIQFRPRWIFRDRRVPDKYLGSTTLDHHLPTKVFHNTTGWPPAGHTSKCIVDPEKILNMWVHFALIILPGGTKLEIAPEQAIIRHYRDLAASHWGRKWMSDILKFGPLEQTDYPPDEMRKLHANMRNRLDRVYNDTLS